MKKIRKKNTQQNKTNEKPQEKEKSQIFLENLSRIHTVASVSLQIRVEMDIVPALTEGGSRSIYVSGDQRESYFIAVSCL